MKKLTLLIAMFTFAFGTAQAKDWKEIRFGIEGAYPPFSQTEARRNCI